MANRRRTVKFISAVLAGALMFLPNLRVYAAGQVTMPVDGNIRVISVQFPTMSEDGDTPFDFILDPQQLIYETNAAKYGGGRVEENATLLFMNHDGEYDFSSRSDKLTVINRSNVPVNLTVIATVSDLGDIELTDSDEFGESTSCSMFLALVDDEGNELPISENDEVMLNLEMMKAPDNAYIYQIDEETGTYTYELSSAVNDGDFASYSFGLVGRCNPAGNWENIYVHPKVKVTWRIDTGEADTGEVDTEESEDAVDTGGTDNTGETGEDEKAPKDEETDNPVIEETESPGDEDVVPEELPEADTEPPAEEDERTELTEDTGNLQVENIEQSDDGDDRAAETVVLEENSQ